MRVWFRVWYRFRLELGLGSRLRLGLDSGLGLLVGLEFEFNHGGFLCRGNDAAYVNILSLSHLRPTSAFWLSSHLFRFSPILYLSELYQIDTASVL